MPGVTLTLTEEDGITAGLRGIREKLASPRPLLDRIGAVLESSTIARFDEQRAPDGTPWKPSRRALGDSAVKVGKPRKDGSRLTVMGRIGKTLVLSGHLRGSITHVADDQAVDVGTNLVYAGVHQAGATITGKGGGRLKFRLQDGRWVSPKSVTIPARPFLGISAEDRVAVDDEIAAALNPGAAA